MTRLDYAGAWDIECASWDRFKCGALRSRDGADSFLSWCEDDFFAELRSRTGTWYAHAGGRYDALWFLGQCVARGIPWSARTRGSGLLSVRIGKLEIRDSYAIVPMELAKGARLGGMEKSTAGLPCECGANCGGFCALSRELTPAEISRVESYVMHDVECTIAMLDALRERAERDDIDLRLTVGSSAWATARRWLSLRDCTHDLGRYAALREGYYGGRVEVFRTHAARGERYDIHSSYPAALTRVAIPIGEPEQVDSAVASVAFEAGMEGIYTADVYVPECEVPPLPVRAKDRLLYPYGPLSGTWTGIELRYAVECGASIERMRESWVFEGSEVRLREYAERVWALRDAAANAGEKEWSAWYKWLANSLTGKLGQRPEQSSIRFLVGDPPDVREGEDIRYITDTGVYAERTTRRVDACAHVEWSAYLTAEARIELHRQLSTTSVPIYCDTDSVYAGHALTRRIGDALGQWGHEGSLADWQALAPKVYRYTDGNGKVHVRGKGFSGLDADGFAALAAGAAWSRSAGVEGIRTAMRRVDDALFRRRTLSRRVHITPGWVGGRELPHGAVATRPTTLARYSARKGR